MLEVGTLAPDFRLQDQSGKEVKLSDYRGKKVILYFYPKDNTAGCTKQACTFGEYYPQIKDKQAEVIGISKDSVKSHRNFALKYNLPFTILADPDLAVIKAYDVWVEKKMYGRAYMGIERSTYLIDEKGYIIKVYQKVKPALNPEQVVGDL